MNTDDTVNKNPFSAGAKKKKCFLSLRFTNKAVKDFAKALKDALERQGHEVFLCAAGTGDEFGVIIGKALFSMDYMVSFVTLNPNYGANAGGKYTTYYELKYAFNQGKK